jgi:putative addiction module component (TIGR02574 family)
MSDDEKQIIDGALKLPPEARAALAGTLLESLEEPPDETAEEAWAEEIRRRLDDLDSGFTKSIPWPEARRRILGR